MRGIFLLPVLVQYLLGAYLCQYLLLLCQLSLPFLLSLPNLLQLGQYLISLGLADFFLMALLQFFLFLPKLLLLLLVVLGFLFKLLFKLAVIVVQRLEFHNVLSSDL